MPHLAVRLHARDGLVAGGRALRVGLPGEPVVVVRHQRGLHHVFQPHLAEGSHRVLDRCHTEMHTYRAWPYPKSPTQAPAASGSRHQGALTEMSPPPQPLLVLAQSMSCCGETSFRILSSDATVPSTAADTVKALSTTVIPH
jgi:hypothetical protein